MPGCHQLLLSLLGAVPRVAACVALAAVTACGANDADPSAQATSLPSAPRPPAAVARALRAEGPLAFASGRTVATHLEVMQGDGSGRRRVATADGVDEPAWSPDGETLAFVRVTGTVRDVAVWADDAVRTVTDGGATVYELQWSRRGNLAWIAVEESDPEHGGRLVVRASDGRVRTVADDVSAFAWHPDGRTLLAALGAPFTRRELVRLAPSGAATRITHVGFVVHALAATGGTVGFVHGPERGLWPDEHVDVVTADGRDRRHVGVAPGRGPIHGAAWSPDRRLVAGARGHDGLALFDVRTEAVRTVDEQGHHPAWSRSGRFLAYVAYALSPLADGSCCTRTRADVYVHDRSTSRTWRLTHDGAYKETLAWSG